MSQENVETVQRIYAGVTARSETPRELVAVDYELDVTDVSPQEVGVLRGYDAAEQALRDYWKTFDDFHVELVELIHADAALVVNAVRDGGRIKGSDVEVRNRYFHVWTCRDGKVVRLSVHTDRSRALDAAGLSE